ncbi:histamine H2 receptor-like [Physella acuta]|uniref:histamine H2 receptor-like n=1 Tax=Physella acuta TaxID=109671 RepID=UPI0027DB3397|nr:histamine H2 receptor-like [Physella acuta]XP_059161634.1 histamine H2 receptor-like [Physella acuta]
MSFDFPNDTFDLGLGVANGSAPDNSTGSKTTPDPWSVEFASFLAAVNILASFCIIAGNAMVLVVIVRHKGMRTRTNLFLVNLAVADMLVGAMVIPFTITTLLEHGWIFSKAVCLFNGWMNAICLVTSIHTLMYISIHKYFSIVRPLHNPLTLKYIVSMMVAAWLWAAVVATLNIMFLKVEYKPGTSQCGPLYPHNTETYIIHVIIQITCLILPFIILVFCYVKIFREIKALSKRLRAHSSAEDVAIFAQEKAVAVTMFIVLATFFIMALPYLAYSNYTTIVKNKKHFSSYFNPVAYTFLYLSSMCNPIIYAFRSQAFREGYKEILCQTATYTTPEDAQLLPRTSRLSSIISVLRRGSKNSGMSSMNKNGDIVVTRGDRIVCVRRAGEGRQVRPSLAGAKFNLLHERVTEMDEEPTDVQDQGEVVKASDDEQSSAECDDVFDDVASKNEEMSNSVSCHSNGKTANVVSGMVKRGSNGKNKVKNSPTDEGHEASGGEGCHLLEDITEYLREHGTRSDQRAEHGNNETPSRNNGEDRKKVSKKPTVVEMSRTEGGPRGVESEDEALLKALSGASRSRTVYASKTDDDVSRPSRGRLDRGISLSKSSEDLSRPAYFLRLPSQEFLDPPIELFRPRSNTGEKMSRP